MKEEEIRKRDVFNKYLELVRIDSETIFSDKSTFININCPACAGTNFREEFEKADFNYVQCNDCDTLFVNPRPKYEDLMEIYNDSPSTKFWVNEFFLPVAEIRRENIFKPRAEYITEKFPELRKRVIGDIGSGFGIFLEELRRFWPEANLIAIEPFTDMAEICREKGLSVIESMLEDVDPSGYHFYLLTSFELFEHLYNPRSFLEKIYDLLNPGGHFFMTTLNGLGFDIQLLWEKSKSVSPPHHLNFFNPSSITKLMGTVGFEVVEISTPGKLDWDIIESGYIKEGIDPGRFFRTVTKYGTENSKSKLQSWISNNNFSSHMRVISVKV